jgi:ribosomal protein L32
MECGHCGELKLNHHICPSCGYYGHGNKEKSILKKVEQDVVEDDE